MDDVAKQRAQRTRRRKRRQFVRRFIFVAISISLVLWWQWPAVTNLFDQTNTPPTSDDTPSSLQEPATTTDTCEGNTPDFDVITPHGAPVDSLGGCVASPPENENPYFVYRDTVKGISIQVTEQVLPEEFATDTQNKLANLAENYNRTITAADNTTVRIGASSGGEQFLILSKHELLIIIKAVGTLNDTQWIEYIDSLE